MDQLENMSSMRPYLLKALYTWILDNNCSPYIVVDAEYPGAVLPMRYVENGKIVLNIAGRAVQNLNMTNELVEFNARFAGVPTLVSVPTMAIKAMYAFETGRGMVFAPENDVIAPPPPVDMLLHMMNTQKPNATKSSASKPPVKTGRPNLTVVKNPNFSETDE